MINELKNYSKESKYSYTLGMSLTIEALKGTANRVKRIYISSKVHQNDHLDLLCKLANAQHIDIIEDDKFISSLSIKENCYCIGVFEKFEHELKNDNHIVLLGYEDEGILGTTLRSAISFDNHDIVLIDNKVDLFSPRTVRASMGAIFHCNFGIYENIVDYINDYPNQNCYALLNRGDKELQEVTFDSPYSVFINYRDEKIKNIDNNIYIKHLHDENLNLEMRSTILFHYLFASKRS